MKYKNVRRIISVLLSAELILCGAEPLLAAETTAVSTALSAYSARTAEYVYKKVTAPAFGSIGGEWAVIGLSRAEAAVPDEYYQGYLKRLTDYVKEKKGHTLGEKIQRIFACHSCAFGAGSQCA